MLPRGRRPREAGPARNFAAVGTNGEGGAGEGGHPGWMGGARRRTPGMEGMGRPVTKPDKRADGGRDREKRWRSPTGETAVSPFLEGGRLVGSFPLGC